MLAGAVALGVLSTPDGGSISFDLVDLQHRTLGTGTQEWIFLLFAIAFVVKAPLFPFHGWVVDTYRATPTPVLVLLSAVLSKVGVYGFLRIVLPILPDATHHFQDLMLALAVFSILYGSILAFSQDEPRLVVAYSSIAQLGFITLGIFSLDGKGAQGALIQMINHALVTAALFFIIAMLVDRAGGSTTFARMGGMATRAPVLATLFLIVSLGTLAMPGSPNFVGEILILFGTFQHKLAFGIVASIGVALAAVYMVRAFQRAMHNRPGADDAAGVRMRDLGALDFALLAPLTAVIVALGVYPQVVLERSQKTTVAKIAPAARVADQQVAAK
jgi:NADH-quinone oxidoreductase subunit M